MDGKMRALSIGRRSSSNPVRVSMMDREDKNGGRADAKRPQKLKPPTQVDNSHIPRPRFRSSSSERTSIRRSTLKPMGKTPLRQQHLSSQPVRVSNVCTPLYTGARASAVGSNHRLHPDLPSGTRHRSPSAERASGFGAKGPRKDNRPLADKAYQNSMLGKIDQYFYEIQQTSLLNNSGSLRPITLKIFVEATNCLVKLLDVKQDLTIVNYMDEIPKIAKRLRYPGAVTKSWLKTANTMHSWPQVLGWLSWLAELCEANDKAELAFGLEDIPFLGTGDEAETPGRSFLAMLDAYVVWNERPEEEAALVEHYVEEMSKKFGDIDKDTEEEMALFEREKANINDGDRQEAELDAEIAELNRILDGHKHDELRELEAARATEETTKRAIHETNRLNVECEALEERIEKDVAQMEKMLVIVQNQKMTVEKRDDIINRCSQIQIDINQLDNHIKDMENEVYALDLKFSSTNSSLYKAVLAYNKNMVMHLGCGTGADLEALKIPETHMLRPDYIDILKTKEAELMNLKEDFRKRYKQTKSAVDAKTNDLEALEDRLRALREENKDYVAKAQEQRLCIQEIQREAKCVEAKLKDQIKNLVNDIVHLEKSRPDVEAASNELAEAQDKFEAVARRAEFVEKRMEKFFKHFYQEMASHRSELDAVLNKLPKQSTHGARTA